jgi:hypothetical protein
MLIYYYANSAFSPFRALQAASLVLPALATFLNSLLEVEIQCELKRARIRQNYLRPIVVR